MPSPYNKKTTNRKKMSSQDGSITVNGGNCVAENENVSSGEKTHGDFNVN